MAKFNLFKAFKKSEDVKEFKEFKIMDSSGEDARLVFDKLTDCVIDNVPELYKNRYSRIYKKIVNKRGKTVAVCIAECFVWNAVQVGALWVDAKYRKQGLGSQLLETVEKIAAERGCTLIHLDTFDFQAKDFYVKQGYKVFGILNDSPEGHCRYYLSKRLSSLPVKNGASDKTPEPLFKAKLFPELTPAELYEILKARSVVFQYEQNIKYVDEDDVDYNALHCFFEDNGRVTAYLRAFPENGSIKIGRVLTITRGKGDGRLIMERGVEAARKRFGKLTVAIDAQKHAEGFYKKLGFITTSDEFLEEGIVHVKMELKP